MHKEGSLFPTQQGIPLAKDAWMMGIGLGLVIDDLTDRLARRTRACPPSRARRPQTLMRTMVSSLTTGMPRPMLEKSPAEWQ